MAHARHISATAQALFRVFIQPTIAVAPTTTPRAASSLLRPSAAPAIFIPALSPHSQRRTAAKYRPPVERTTPYDEEIASIYVNVVDEEGVFRPGERLTHVLAAMDRVTNHLVQLSPPLEGSEHPFPVCKVVSKSALREEERAKARLRTRKTIDDLTKTIELNWAVSANDLQHWLKRLKEFLEEGRRVEVVMGPKKRGRKATPEEAEHVLQSVKETVAEVAGAKERTAPEGELGAIMTLFYDGPKEGLKERQKQIQEEKQKQKQMLEEKELERLKRKQKQIQEDGQEKPAESATGQQNQPKVSRWKIKEEERRKQAEIEKAEEAEAEKVRLQREAMQQQREALGGGYGQGGYGQGGYGQNGYVPGYAGFGRRQMYGR
ncbi:putative translation initiation factor [Diplodia seriata]|uniref:Putative translation initiation factor n=1 Tax=Diplodia seriata TaxID=420778 RepID=A0A0G2F096_9PEZI|nr:putative translation initiation factor [Diplodia seriata]